MRVLIADTLPTPESHHVNVRNSRYPSGAFRGQWGVAEHCSRRRPAAPGAAVKSPVQRVNSTVTLAGWVVVFFHIQQYGSSTATRSVPLAPALAACFTG